LWNIGGNARWGKPAATLGLFDKQSLALIRQLHGDVTRNTPSFDDVVARLEASVVGDSALAELALRGQIRTLLARSAGPRFEPLNAWIYSDVFNTPKSDPWLGLVPRTDFTGLPGDGVVMP